MDTRTIGYMGPEGTFSHKAAEEYSAQCGGTPVEFATIRAVLAAVKDKTVNEGIVPIENSIEGGVNQTLDCLAQEEGLYITGERVISIRQNILIKKGASREDIRVIVSHPQAVGQCSVILATEFAGVRVEFADSTSAAAVCAAESGGEVACIGAEENAKLYGLEVLFADCGDKHNNSTRFVTVSGTPSRRVSGHDKTSIAFSLSNEPGTLYRALKRFADDGINMTKIESRPSKERLGEYVFFVDIEGNIDSPVIYFALDSIRTNTSFYKFLGSYERAEQ